MSPDKVQSRIGGFLVFAVPGSGQAEAVPQFGLRHYETEDKAIEAARKSVELDPASSDAHYLLGQLYQEAGQADLARQELELFQKQKNAAP